MWLASITAVRSERLSSTRATREDGDGDAHRLELVGWRIFSMPS